MLRSVVMLSACLLAAVQGSRVPAQKPGDSALAKIGLEDPFTDGDPGAMAKLGVVGYGPLAWADNLRTTDVEKVLGEGRVLWLETEHFKIGSNLGFSPMPKDTQARKVFKAELKRLNKRCRKIPSSTSKLDPWLRTHLYALRAEELYAEFAQLSGREGEQGHLGQKEKFLLLLFQKKSDLARYMSRFCGRDTQQSQRHRHAATGHYALIMTAEGDDGPRECETVCAQFRFFLPQMFCEAAGGAPPWLSYGLAHHYERQVPCNMINCGIRADESVDPATQYDWPRKIEKRIKHEELCLPFAEMCRQTDLGYYGHVQAWSRVDFLMQDRERFTQLLQRILGNTSRQRQVQALAEVYEMAPEDFDEAWRAWARKHY